MTPNLRARTPAWSILPVMAIRKRGRKELASPAGAPGAPPNVASPRRAGTSGNRPHRRDGRLLAGVGPRSIGGLDRRLDRPQGGPRRLDEPERREAGLDRGASTTGVQKGSTATTPGPTGADRKEPKGRLRSIGGLGPILLLRTAHPRQALLTALGLAVAAALAGRPTREVGLVFATVLVGQAILGWHNDLVDRDRDRVHGAGGKPIAQGRIDPGTVWFSLACGLLLLVPLSLSNGLVAGSSYLIAMAIGLLGNVTLRRGILSWLPWAASFALFPAFLSYGGWGGETLARPFGAPPEIAMTVLAALLGIGVHVLRALPGLVADHADGYRSLPLRIALKTGATKLLIAGLRLHRSRAGRPPGRGQHRRPRPVTVPDGRCTRPLVGHSPGRSLGPLTGPLTGPGDTPGRGARSPRRTTARLTRVPCSAHRRTDAADRRPPTTCEGLTMHFRRKIALALTGAMLAVPALTSCGFNKATDRVYTPAAGVNDQDAMVDVLGAVIVSGQDGSGTFIASFANNLTRRGGDRRVARRRRRHHDPGGVVRADRPSRRVAS